MTGLASWLGESFERVLRAIAGHQINNIRTWEGESKPETYSSHDPFIESLGTILVESWKAKNCFLDHHSLIKGVCF